jgi:hypothetical protein
MRVTNHKQRVVDAKFLESPGQKRVPREVPWGEPREQADDVFPRFNQRDSNTTRSFSLHDFTVCEVCEVGDCGVAGGRAECLWRCAHDKPLSHRRPHVHESRWPHGLTHTNGASILRIFGRAALQINSRGIHSLQKGWH